MPGAETQPGAHREHGCRRQAAREPQRQGLGPRRPGAEPERGFRRRGERQRCGRRQAEKALSSSTLHLQQPGKFLMLLK